MVLNAVLTALAMRITGLSARVAVMVGFSLCQVGEFAFVLASEGQKVGLMTPETMKVFLNMAVLTMAMTPLSLALGRKISPRFADLSSREEDSRVPKLENHAVVVGFGVAGQAVARACHRMGRPYLVIDMNPASVKAFRQLNEPLFFGDAASEHVLEHMGIKRAAVLVVTIPDPTACQRIIAAARNISPDIRILTRTRFLLNIKLLKELGADDVIAEEFEAAIAVFNSMLDFFGLPAEERRKQIALARKADPRKFRIAEVPKEDSLEYPTRPEISGGAPGAASGKAEPHGAGAGGGPEGGGRPAGAEDGKDAQAGPTEDPEDEGGLETEANDFSEPDPS
jgi:CPA2 family monovalent cation:H+ antiporter-2